MRISARLTILVALLLQQLGVETLLVVAGPSDDGIRASLGIGSKSAPTFEFEGTCYFQFELAADSAWCFGGPDDVKSAKVVIPLLES